MAARRRELGLSLSKLSYAAGGVSISTIRRIERGTTVANPATQTALALVLGADVFPLVAAREAAMAQRAELVTA